MTMFVVDTDTLTHLQTGHPVATANVWLHAAHQLATTVISIEEQLAGWYSSLNKSNKPDIVARLYDRLASQVEYLSGWQILRFPESAIDRYQQLKSMKLNIGKMDLKIAAIVLENNGVLVTRNQRDFERVPNLQLVDWTVP